MKTACGLFALVVLIVTSTAPRVQAAPAGDGIDKQIENLIGRMTLEEKLGQLEQLSGDPQTGGVKPEYRDLVKRGLVGSFLNVRGARNVNEIQRLALEQSPCRIPLLLGYDVIHGYQTIFPVPLALASTWDPETVERAARVAALEASACGVRWTFAPMLDIARDPRWGRIVEGPGEDPYLAAAMARAQVRGFQGDNYADPTRLLAGAKHFVAYGAAIGGRDYNSAEVSRRTLREIYFPPFKAALDAGVDSFMSALNSLDGVPATANAFLLTDVLRREWRFDGLVVSDYNAVEQLVPFGLAPDRADAVRAALVAGIDMEENTRLFSEEGPRLVRQRRVPEARVDQAVRRVLRVKHRLNLFDRPYLDERREKEVLKSPQNLAAARDVAARTLVLLKNDGNLLPLSDRIKTIALIGPLADDRQAALGSWHADGKPDDVVTILAGIKNWANAHPASSITINYEKGCDVEGGSTRGIELAADVARKSDVAIVVVGESADMTGEATSRSSLDLPGHQLELVERVWSTATPTVVVLQNGRPLSIGWVASHVPSILETWFAGIQAGNAIALALFGDINPGGKLPVTFPRTVGQVPYYYNQRRTGRPASNYRYTSKYADLPIGPLFPFGHGLSYTRFRLSTPRLSAKTISADGSLTVAVDVENVGNRAGDEVVQLYIQDVAASVVRPARQLRGFRRVTLEPGRKTTATFKLGHEDLGLYNQAMRFVVEPGAFKVYVSTSSEGGAEAQFEVAGERP